MGWLMYTALMKINKNKSSTVWISVSWQNKRQQKKLYCRNILKSGDFSGYREKKTLKLEHSPRETRDSGSQRVTFESKILLQWINFHLTAVLKPPSGVKKMFTSFPNPNFKKIEKRNFWTFPWCLWKLKWSRKLYTMLQNALGN